MDRAALVCPTLRYRAHLDMALGIIVSFGANEAFICIDVSIFVQTCHVATVPEFAAPDFERTRKATASVATGFEV